jgi:hypothetical protein
MDKQIIKYFKEIEKEIKVIRDNKNSALVHPPRDTYYPIHGWYKFKESFSPFLLDNILNKINLDSNVNLLDPFSGSGTTLLSALLSKQAVFQKLKGFEVNPFISFMANTKLKFYSLDFNKANNFLAKIKNINLCTSLDGLIIPELSTIEKAFSTSTLAQLLSLKKIIRDSFDKSDYEHDFFMLVLGAILEPVSCMKKSGRALKVVKDKEDYDIKQVFIKKAEQMLVDVWKWRGRLHTPKLQGEVENCDIRSISVEKNSEKYNLIVFSPPYLNHFDYTEVYKIELWMLDFVKNYDEFKNLRYKTLRSHPSVKFAETSIYKNFKSQKVKNIVEYLLMNKGEEVFSTTVKNYIDDMYITFMKLNMLADDNATVVCIVGNSLFGTKSKQNLTPIATDLLIAEIARDVGFEVNELRSVREITRRGIKYEFGRESIIFMQKKSSIELQKEIDNLLVPDKKTEHV